MRTTVRLEDGLFRQVKGFAAAHGLTFTEVLTQALRELLAQRTAMRRADRVPLPSFRGRGLQSGVDLDDGAALLDLMEGGDGPA